MDKIYIYIFTFFSGFYLMAQSYDLVKIHSELQYYNAVTFKGEIILGTSEGPKKYKNLNVESFSNKFKEPGYLTIRDEGLANGMFFESNQYDFLVPTHLKGSPYTYFIARDYLLMFINRTLWTYQIKPYKFTTSPSVRTISDNLIGTYNGFYNYSLEKQIDLPVYTNGRIIQLTTGLAICWDGLLIKNGDSSFNYFHPESYEVQYEGEILGYARDLIELEENKWLLFSTSGLFFIDDTLKHVTTIIRTYNNEEPKYSYKDEGYAIIYTTDAIYQLSLVDFSLTQLYDSNTAIESVSNFNNWLFYILTTDELKEVNIKDKLSKTLMDGFSEAHTLTNFNNQLLISSNHGLHVFSLITAKGYISLIENEFNKYATYIQNNTVKLGTVSGYYEINQDALNSMYFIEDYEKDQLMSYGILKKFNILKWCLFLVLFLLIPIHFYYKWFINNQRRKFIAAIELPIEEKIKAYILSNLQSITLKSIQEEFNIDQNGLYQIFDEIKPGEFIRQQRIKLVRKMRKENQSEEEISKATGFSLSYLKKI